MKNELENTLSGAYAMHEEACRKSNGSTRRYYIVWAAALLACAVTLLVYLPALENQFVGFDDDVYVMENWRIRSIDLGFLRWIATAVVSSNWHPLTVLSHAMDYGVWGADPFGHHLTSIILHAFNTSLVLILAVRLIGCGSEINGSAPPDKKVLAAALFTALLFGLHPVHVESVAWVSERKDVLCAFFYLLSVLAYLKYASTPGGGRSVFYYSSLALFSSALMSKPMAVSLPAVLLILDYCPLGRLGAGGGLKGAKRVITEKIPFFVLGILASVTTIWAQKTGGAIVAFEILPLADRIAVALRAYVFYIYKVVLPVDLSPFYPYPESTALVSPEYVFYFLVLALVTAMSVLSRKRTKVFTAVWFYYLITLLPVVGIVQVGSQAAADRYTYLPSLGPFILLGLLVAKGFDMRSSRPLRALMVVTAVAIPVLLAALTIAQTAVWKDTVTLWSQQIRLFPMRAPIAYNNLGLAYANQGRTEEAIAEYKTAMALNPGIAEVHNNLGIAYADLGRIDKAVAEYKTALRINPRHAKAHNNLGEALYTKRLYYKAVEEYKKAIASRPGFAEAHNNLGTAYGRMGLLDRAVEELLTALRFGSDTAEIHSNLGKVYKAKGMMEEAAREFERVLEINPNDRDAREGLNSLYR